MSFGCVQLLYYKCHKINPNCGRSYIDSPDWTIKDSKCFQLKKHSERITKITPFISNYNWKRINYSLEIDDWKKCEKNNLAIASYCLIC